MYVGRSSLKKRRYLCPVFWGISTVTFFTERKRQLSTTYMLINKAKGAGVSIAIENHMMYNKLCISTSCSSWGAVSGTID